VKVDPLTVDHTSSSTNVNYNINKKAGQDHIFKYDGRIINLKKVPHSTNMNSIAKLPLLDK